MRPNREPVLPGIFEEIRSVFDRARPRPLPPIVHEKRRQASNEQKVLAHLQKHGAAMNHELVDIGGVAAMRRVHDLRQKGHKIETKQINGSVWRITYRGTP